MSVHVSVIVPSYNYARYLPVCVDSLLAQTYPHWECIIVDDGSTDDTPAVCRRLAASDARIIVTRQENRGLSAARNTGMQRARGEFLQFLDADDLLEPDKLRRQVQRLDELPSADIVVGDAAYFREDEPKNRQEWPVDVFLEKNPLAALVTDNAFVVNAALARRRLVDVVGTFDETLAAHEDWDFWLRCALAGCRFTVLSAVGAVALVRQHAASMSASREKMMKTAMLVRKRLAARLPAELRAQNVEGLSQLQWTFGLELMRAGRMAEGWALFREGLASSRNKCRTLSRLLSLVPGAWQFVQYARKLRQ